MATTQDDRIADLQRTIAELRQERDTARLERDAALVQRIAEFDERIEHQAATIDVLKAMSASPGDPQPVFDLIARQAAKLCNVPTAAVATFDGRMIHLATQSGFDAAYADAYVSQFPRPVGLDSSMGRAILHRRVDQVEDITTAAGHSFVDVLGHWSVMAVPILRDGVPLGAITIGRPAMGPFSDIQVALLQTVAEQAVIAINSAETYRALQTRTSDLQESPEYQTATSDVLKVISRSTFDLQPVLDTLVETAARLCFADQAAIWRRDGDLWRLAANYGFPPEYETYIKTLDGVKLDPDSPTIAQRTATEGRTVHIDDVAAIPGYPEALIRLGKHRTSLGVPLLREGEPIGLIVLARQRVEPFTDRQIALVSTFADQAVIAIENTRLITEQHEALEQQTATAEVLQVINASPGDLVPVFDAMLEKATRLCGGNIGGIFTFDGEHSVTSAVRGVTAAFRQYNDKYPMDKVRPGTVPARIIETRGPVQYADVTAGEPYRAGHPYARALVELGGIRAVLAVPLLKDGVAVGMVAIYRQEVGAFSDKQIVLLQNFAAQAVIAMENARLLTEQREALEQQTATAEVLQVINASAGNLQPVFDVILEKAHGLCDIAQGSLELYDGERFRAVAVRGMSDAFADMLRLGSSASDNPATRPLIAGGRFSHIRDLAETDYSLTQSAVELEAARTLLCVPLRRDDRLLGMIASARREVRPFSEKEITLLENFAAQAVIAMENARLLDEIRQRQEELRITFENMGDGVAMFDETPRLVAWNRKFQEMLDVPDEILAERRTYADYIRYLTERGEYGPDAGTETQLDRFQERMREHYNFERTRPDGRVMEVHHNPVADGGFVLIYADITERKRSEVEIRAARDAAEEASRTIEAAYRDLKTAQANLIQAEKMASLGQLTAGIAHEIKNPLNFVNNFAALSNELIDELREVLTPQPLGDTARAEVGDLTALLKGNLEKVVQHGQRADGIVKAMLEHSRGSSVERRMVDLNTLIDEALNRAYHGARAQDQSFNITLERDFDEGIAPIEVNPQDMTRVFLNLLSNAFYATTRRARDGGAAGFEPTLEVTTRDAGEAVEIRVRDNGTGIPADIRDKLFQPFFTTKPTGEGTGLGLSITYDIVTKQHGGTITVESEVDAFTEFVITLPR